MHIIHAMLKILLCVANIGCPSVLLSLPAMQGIVAGAPDAWSQLDRMLQSAATEHQVAELQGELAMLRSLPQWPVEAESQK